MTKLIEIDIHVKGIKLNEDEARKVYQKLKEHFDKKETTFIPYYPPYEKPYRPYWQDQVLCEKNITYCSDGTGVLKI